MAIHYNIYWPKIDLKVKGSICLLKITNHVIKWRALATIMKNFTAKEQIFLLDIMNGNFWLFLDRTSLLYLNIQWSLGTLRCFDRVSTSCRASTRCGASTRCRASKRCRASIRYRTSIRCRAYTVLPRLVRSPCLVRLPV